MAEPYRPRFSLNSEIQRLANQPPAQLTAPAVAGPGGLTPKLCTRCGVQRMVNVSKDRTGLCRSCYDAEEAKTRAPDWLADAECLDEDPELFFPVSEINPEELEKTAKAKKVCRRCDVRELCLAYAMDTKARYGIFGGLTERERDSLKRSQQRKSRAVSDA